MQVVIQTTRYYATLREFIVTPAVYQLLAPLNRGLKYWHWADITFYTNLYRLAKS